MLHKILLWLLVYPVAFVIFFSVAILEAVTFLFNSPVDIWILISEAVDGVESHDS